jgi:hypothetical protein
MAEGQYCVIEASLCARLKQPGGTVSALGMFGIKKEQ